MKNLLKYFTISCIALFVFSCKEDSSVKPDGLDNATHVTSDELYEFEPFSLKPYGINAMIYLPDETSDIGASTNPIVKHELDGFKWDLTLGNNFEIIIDDWGKEDMIAIHKKELQDYANLYNIEFIEETPTFLSYKKDLKVKGVEGAGKDVGVEHTTYHCYGLTKIDDINYVFRSSDQGHLKAYMKYIATSIKSVEEINNAIN